MNTIRGTVIYMCNVSLNVSDGHLITAFLPLRRNYRGFFMKILLFNKYLS